jgi:regulator of protease activity HflC (stomatin/prohibitin superfamily)
MKEITPPKDVQETMNQVIKAQNEKEAAIDFATSKETQADGLRRAAIKEAEGKKQANILEAEGIKQSKIMIAQGEAEAIKLVNEAADKFFKGNAVELKRLETVEEAMSKNSKFILTSDLVDRVSKVLNGVKQNESVQ